MAFRIAVLDDDAVLCGKICRLILQQAQKHSCNCVCVPFSNAFDVETDQFDAYLLDISMPEMDGIQLALHLRGCGIMCPIIFISGIESRVFDALRSQPLRFVRKSHLAQELPQAAQALFHQFEIYGSSMLRITTNRLSLNLPTHTILYIESFDKQQKIVTAERSFQVYSSMQYFENELANRGFFRIHRCYMVNMSAVTYIDKQQAVMNNGVHLPISRFKLQEAKDRLRKELFRL